MDEQTESTIRKQFIVDLIRGRPLKDFEILELFVKNGMETPTPAYISQVRTELEQRKRSSKTKQPKTNE